MPARRADLQPKTALFPHQAEAVGFIIGKKEVAIFDEQGLGKTKIVLDAMLGELSSGAIEGVLIVCRASLIPMWRAEIAKHTNTSAAILSGDRRRAGRAYMLFSPFHIVAYSLLSREITNLRGLLSLRKFALVLDESHTIKNPRATVTLNAIALAELAAQRVILTGTPVANYPEDLWAQFRFLDGGRALGPDFDLFRLQYSLGSGVSRRNVSSANLREISEAIRPISLRRTKAEVLDLPEKSYVTKRVSLTGVQAKMYEQARDQLRVEITGERGTGATLDIENILERMLRLVQLASNPGLIWPDWGHVPAKFGLLDSELRAAMRRGEKAIVWSQFVENVVALRLRYREYGAAAIHGGVPIEKRSAVVTRFQEGSDCKVLVAVPAAAREGLTLTAANNAFYLDRGFNLVDYLQSQDRIHRIGQARASTIVKLVATGTIDEFVEEVLSRKAEIANAIQSGVEPRPATPLVTETELVRVLGGEGG
jgi:SWI/SNF-related matrix-associated actin-dependent regulator of chromatin subfamily A-like protein 1